MTLTPPPGVRSLELRRSFAVPAERLFRAWTESAALSEWFSPSGEYTVIVHALEVRAGGGFRIEMRHTSGRSHCAIGTYREVSRPERLSFTWRWEDQPDMPETLVTVVLRPRDEATELMLTHEGFGSDGMRDDHEKGWGGCLDRLSGFSARR